MAWGNWCFCSRRRSSSSSRGPALSVLPSGGVAVLAVVVALAAVADGVAHERPAINAGAAAAAFGGGGGGGGGSRSPAPAPRPPPTTTHVRPMRPMMMNHSPAPPRMMHRMKHMMPATFHMPKPMPKHGPTQAYPTYEKEDYDDHKYEWYKKPQKHGYGQDTSYGHKYSQKSYTPSYGSNDYEEEEDYYQEPSYRSYGDDDNDDYEEDGYGAYEESYDHAPSYGHGEYEERRPSYRHRGGFHT